MSYMNASNFLQRCRILSTTYFDQFNQYRIFLTECKNNYEFTWDVDWQKNRYKAEAFILFALELEAIHSGLKSSSLLFKKALRQWLSQPIHSADWEEDICEKYHSLTAGNVNMIHLLPYMSEQDDAKVAFSLLVCDAEHYGESLIWREKILTWKCLLCQDRSFIDFIVRSTLDSWDLSKDNQKVIADTIRQNHVWRQESGMTSLEYLQYQIYSNINYIEQEIYYD